MRVSIHRESLSSITPRFTLMESKGLKGKIDLVRDPILEPRARRGFALAYTGWTKSNASLGDETPGRETTNATRKVGSRKSGKEKEGKKKRMTQNKKKKEKINKRKERGGKLRQYICNQSCCCSRYCPLLDVTYVLYTCAMCARVWSPLA